jgi:hypothetical protein
VAGEPGEVVATTALSGVERLLFIFLFFYLFYPNWLDLPSVSINFCSLQKIKK